MTILRQLERRGADPRAEWGSSVIPTNGQIGFSAAAGIAMNDDVAMSIGTVYTCLAILCDSIAGLPLEAYRRKDEKYTKPIWPAPPLIENPWPDGILGTQNTRQDFFTQAVMSLGLRGNFFGRGLAPDSKGYPTMIQPFHPDTVMAWRNRGTGLKEYRQMGRIVPLEQMVHIPALLMPGSFIGLNPVEYMRQSWSMAVATERYGAAFFANSANPSGVITTLEDLSEDETLALARAWAVKHQGLGNAQYPAVLTGGATWTQMSLSPDDAQFLLTRDYQRTEIGSFFRIPQHMLGLQDRTSSWGTGIEQMEIGFVINTLRPWLMRLEAYMSNLLPPTQICKFNLGGRLRGDTLQRYQGYTLARNGGWMNIDEIRFLEDLPPLPDGLGQDHWAPLNFAPLDQMHKGLAAGKGDGGIGGGIENSPDAPPAPGP